MQNISNKKPNYKPKNINHSVCACLGFKQLHVNKFKMCLKDILSYRK